MRLLIPPLHVFNINSIYFSLRSLITFNVLSLLENSTKSKKRFKRKIFDDTFCHYIIIITRASHMLRNNFHIQYTPACVILSGAKSTLKTQNMPENFHIIHTSNIQKYFPPIYVYTALPKPAVSWSSNGRIFRFAYEINRLSPAFSEDVVNTLE